VSAVRDPPADNLLTQQNEALIVIDYQPSQIAAVRSMEPTWGSRISCRR